MCGCRPARQSSIVGGTPNPVFVSDPLEYVQFTVISALNADIIHISSCFIINYL